ncbi:MAG TPA: hypothetical protein VMV10_12640 [Pirellulales bacterium]|nr:hypothetical protein [Pirellulales bacterium]
MQKPPFQFGLKAVFAATTGAAALLAIFHYVPLFYLALAAMVICWYAALIVVTRFVVHFLTH